MGCPELGAQVECPFGVVDPYLAVIGFGLDERRMPVWLSAVVDCVHHEGVDVRKRQIRSLHGLQYPPLLYCEHAGGPGVGYIGEQLQALVAE